MNASPLAKAGFTLGQRAADAHASHLQREALPSGPKPAEGALPSPVQPPSMETARSGLFHLDRVLQRLGDDAPLKSRAAFVALEASLAALEHGETAQSSGRMSLLDYKMGRVGGRHLFAGREELDAQLSAVDASLAAFDTIAKSLPEGVARLGMEKAVAEIRSAVQSRYART